MSLFKSLKELTVATVQLAKEDKTFRKELAIATVTAPIWIAKVNVDFIDTVTGATKNLEQACDKLDQKTKRGIYTEFSEEELQELNDFAKSMKESETPLQDTNVFNQVFKNYSELVK